MAAFICSQSVGSRVSAVVPWCCWILHTWSFDRNKTLAIQPVQWLIAESPVNSPKAAAVELPEGQVLPRKSILGIPYPAFLIASCSKVTIIWRNLILEVHRSSCGLLPRFSHICLGIVEDAKDGWQVQVNMANFQLMREVHTYRTWHDRVDVMEIDLKYVSSSHLIGHLPVC